MRAPTFMDLPDAGLERADVAVLPLPYEATASYGRGTARAPAAVVAATAQTELWDEELGLDLEGLACHVAPAVCPAPGEAPADYLARVETAARRLHRPGRLVLGVGGEHSLTPPLVAAAVGAGDWAGLTVVQLDAHADLRDQYEGTPHSHACAMRRVVERGARLVAVGIRSADRAEWEWGRQCGRVRTFTAQALATGATEAELVAALRGLAGDVYLTVDVDGLEVSLAPGTGTPQPGGLGWWQTLRYLRALLFENRTARLLGCDVVETVPMPHTQVNEFTAARLLSKVIAYRFARP